MEILEKIDSGEYGKSSKEYGLFEMVERVWVQNENTLVKQL